MNLAVALAACLAWAVLLLGRGFFWLARDDDADAAGLPEPAAWPAVVALVPARDEAETIGATVRSLLGQDYPGEFRLVVVDDRSTDGTGEAARAAGDARLVVLRGGPREAGWTGKLWALEQGLRWVGASAPPPQPSTAERGREPTPPPPLAAEGWGGGGLAAEATTSPPTYLLFTDADIRHAPDSLRRLVQRALAGRLVLVSLMARLRCESPAERWLIPAFIFFFQMLYPFRWARDPEARTAAAAGGCVLLDRAAFARAGGLAGIRGALIDDCALAAQLKRQGPIWVGLTERVESLRPYEDIGPIRRMVARTAYAQLGYSPLLLAGMLLALTLVFLAPPALAILGSGAARGLGLLAWAAMALAYGPTLRRFGLSPWRGLALPGIAATYMAFTLDSAFAEWRGRGGMWKGEAGPRADRATGPR